MLGIGRAMERVAQVARETGHLDGVQAFRGADLGEVARRPNRRITARAIDTMRNRRTFTLASLRAFGDSLGSADTERIHLFADDLAGLGALVASQDAAALLRRRLAVQ